ncbi:MAG: hypothetical protein ACXABD_09640 [Candidatus Thorarchaeota archaeon]
MRRIGRNIRDTVRRGTSQAAVVIDVAGSKVSVRLSNRGAIYRNLDLVGGPVSIGDFVHVDFTTDDPTVVAPGRPYEAQFEALEDAIEPPDSDVGTVAEPESGMIEVYLPGEWSASGSAGQYWKDPTAGSFFDANSEGMDTARSYAVPGSAIFTPRGEIGGDHWFWYGITLIGYGQGESFLTGQITFRNSYHVRDVSFVRSTNSAGGEVGVVVYGDGYFYQCDFTGVNYGAGYSIGIMNDQMSSYPIFDNCHFDADVGMWGNANGGKNSIVSPNRFYITNSGSHGWHVEYMSALWMRFHEETDFAAEEFMIDGFTLHFLCGLYDFDAVQVKVIFECIWGTGHGETNHYTESGEKGHWLEDMSFYFDPVYGGGTPNPAQAPEIPVEDESHFTHRLGFPSYSDYGPGDTISMVWNYQDHGLGSDVSSGSAGNQSERTSTDWTPYPNHQHEGAYMWLTRRMGNSSGSDARFNQDGYDLDMRPKYVYFVDGEGYKRWVYPMLFSARLYQCSFDCGTWDVRAEDYCHVIADSPSYNEAEKVLGNITLDANLGIPDFGATAPDNPYPGQLWYPIDV